MNTSSLLHVDSVTLRYKTQKSLVTATEHVSFDLNPSDRLILLGPSGCGKSTLLKAVGGYLKPDAGQILLNGHPIRQPGPERMMVFQEFDQLLPWLTVKENVMFGLTTARKTSRKEAEERALYYIHKVRLEEFANHYPHTLSGGMKQRVAIARGMAMEPKILLMDEPFAALDALTRQQMQDELLQLWADIHFTMLFVTHSIAEAIKLGDRILLLSPHPGKVKEQLFSDGTDRVLPTGELLSQYIHQQLFNAPVEELDHA